MVYRAIGLMSGSSLDGLDIVFVEFQETSGKWSYSILAADCFTYADDWSEKLRMATSSNALHYQLLHTEFGHYIGEQVNRFIDQNNLQYQVQLIASHGHTSFHVPSRKMTAQLGDGAAIAATTGINVVSDLRAMDIALGGQGAPIVPIGEKLLMGDYDLFLNLGGIANISYNHPGQFIAFDICPANRILNMLALLEGYNYDEGGKMAADGMVQDKLLNSLNGLPYYQLPFPKSLANDFGNDVVFPMIRDGGNEIGDGGYGIRDGRYGIADKLRTYVEHIAIQIKNAIQNIRIYQQLATSNQQPTTSNQQLLVTGGGAHNISLIERIKSHLQPMNIEVVVPDDRLVDFKEALIMAFIGVLRWREENNTLTTVTGASRDSIGGAVWIGQEW